ncbi:hypothetical protein [Bradyrhizobium sp. AUGA SZCCT0283]|jgi:hypothetical protein|uniref:hypothetical protein n=1 Tax=Bradyrhizobium sp. AUGA SZCCT0283 TaxID=2807671 RepID=UPI002011D206|nr:hypothetical protein [Bradyrhizobium sp. AUGA SZCCT0283]
MLAAVFLQARVGIWYAIAASDVILIEADGIYALGKETPSVGIDQPKHTVMFVNAKKPASSEATVGDATPFCPFQSNTPAVK